MFHGGIDIHVGIDTRKVIPNMNLDIGMNPGFMSYQGDGPIIRAQPGIGAQSVAQPQYGPVMGAYPNMGSNTGLQPLCAPAQLVSSQTLSHPPHGPSHPPHGPSYPPHGPIQPPKSAVQPTKPQPKPKPTPTPYTPPKTGVE